MIRQAKRVTKWAHSILREPFAPIESRHNDLLAMAQLKPLYTTYLPWSNSALRPSAIVVILNDIVIHQRRNIVEFGAGLSTYFIARTLASYPGHLFSVEHDDKWLNIVSAELKREGLRDRVTLIHAPLIGSRHNRQQRSMQRQQFDYQWYDTSILDEQLPDSDIDLVIVDGPPAYRDEQRHARYPALPYLVSRLSDDYTFIIDDANRAGERSVIAQWQNRHDTKFSTFKVRGNIAMCKSRSSYTI